MAETSAVKHHQDERQYLPFKTMPTLLPLSPAQKKKIFTAYASGQSPSQISISLRDIKLTPLQISNLCVREGWSKRKKEIAEIKERSAQEVLEQARKSGIPELEQILGAIKEGALIDSERLRDSWDLVTGAADASSLQRAKGLLLNRTLKLFGIENEPEEHGAGSSITLVIGTPTPQTEYNVEALDVESAELADDDNESEEIEFEDGGLSQ